MKQTRNQNFGKILAMLGIGGLVRLILTTRLDPLLIDPSYTDSARYLLTFHFRQLGDRAPTYPLLLALCGNNFHAVWFVQSLMGMAISLMIFDMVLRHTRRGSVARVAGLACSSIRDPLICEC